MSGAVGLRPPRRAGWLVAALATAVALASIGPWPVGVFQDDGLYVVLAKSLATGEGYRFLNLPGAPNATHYPPLYPAFLALLWHVTPAFPDNVFWFKVANALLLGASTGPMLRLARRHAGLGPWGALFAVGAFTACAPLVLLTVMVLSEPLFLCGLGVTLLLAERAASTGRVRDAAGAGAAIAVLALVRTLGVLVAPAACLVLAWRRRWAAAAVLAATVAVGLLPWQWWVAAHAAEVPAVFLGKYGSYLGWLGDAVWRNGVGFLFQVGWYNARELVALGWASTATELLPGAIRAAVSVALVGVLAGGWWRLRRHAPVLAAFLLGYLAIVLAWPFAPARFCWAVWPLVGMVVAHAAAGLAALAPAGAPRARRVARGAGAAGLALLAAGYARYNYLGHARDWWGAVQGNVANRARPLAQWVRANTDSAAVIATDDDVLIHLYTGRRAVPTGKFTAEEHLAMQTPAFAVTALREILRTYPIDYVLATTNYGVYAVRGLMEARPPLLRLVRPLAFGAVFAPAAGVRP